MSGHSKIRNKAIANIFNQMGLVEAWGTGIRRIREVAESYGFPTPEILVFDNMFRVNLYRNPIFEMHEDQNKASEKHQKKSVADLNDTQKDFGAFGC